MAAVVALHCNPERPNFTIRLRDCFIDVLLNKTLPNPVLETTSSSTTCRGGMSAICSAVRYDLRHLHTMFYHPRHGKIEKLLPDYIPCRNSLLRIKHLEDQVHHLHGFLGNFKHWHINDKIVHSFLRGQLYHLGHWHIDDLLFDSPSRKLLQPSIPLPPPCCFPQIRRSN